MSDTNLKGVIVLHFGPMEMDFIGKAAKLCGKQAVLGQDTARMAGAMLAVGNKDLLDALKEKLSAGAIDEAMSRYAHTKLSASAIKWLASGERGTSSEVMFSVLTGVKACDDSPGGNYPHDPDDFRRCELMLIAVPGFRGELHRMASHGPVWSGLVAKWGEIIESFDTEAPDWRSPDSQWSAPKTYELMRQIIKTSEEV